MRHLIEGRRCYEAGDWPKAEQLYRKVLEADPHNGEGLEHMGLLAMRAKDPASAAEWLQKAVNLDTRDAKLYNVLVSHGPRSNNLRRRPRASGGPRNLSPAGPTRITTGATRWCPLSAWMRP